MATRKNSRNGGSGILNVLFHGAFVFIVVRDNGSSGRDKTKIHALIPRLRRHVCRAGNLFAETQLQGGRGAVYNLEGVHAGDVCEFDRNRNIYVKCPPKRPSTPVPYATVRLPCPNKITSLRLAKVRREFFSHRDELVVPGDWQSMATLQIFEYYIDDPNRLALKADRAAAQDESLEDHHWEPAFTGNTISLQIHSSEEYFHKPSNAQEDFNQCVKLLGARLRLNTRFLPACGIPQDNLPPISVHPEETEDLASRTRRLAHLGRLVVQGGDLNLVWNDIEALDGTIDACGDLVSVCEAI